MMMRAKLLRAEAANSKAPEGDDMKRFAACAAVLCIVTLVHFGRGQTEPQRPAAGASGGAGDGSSSPGVVVPTQLLSPPPAPPTILESQSLAQGVLTVKGYTDVATLIGDDD